MKRCTLCRTEKPLTEFYPARGPKVNKDGLRPRCKDCVKALVKDWQKLNPKDPEQERERLRKFRQQNPGRDAEYGRRWREKNPEHTQELARARLLKYRETKPERHIASQMRRRARLQAMTRDDEDFVAVLRNDPCSYCGTYGRTVDHIESLYYGGGSSWGNLTAACASCNCSKGTDTLLSFLLRTASRS